MEFHRGRSAGIPHKPAGKRLCPARVDGELNGKIEAWDAEEIRAIGEREIFQTARRPSAERDARHMSAVLSDVVTRFGSRVAGDEVHP